MSEIFTEELKNVKKFFETISNRLNTEEIATINTILKKLENKPVSSEQKDVSIMLKDHGNVLFKEGKLQEALELYTQALNADPTNYFVYSNRALIYQKLGQNDNAIKDCVKGIEIEPSFEKFYIRIATIYKESDKEKALEYIEKGLIYQPQNPALLEMKAELSNVTSPFDSLNPSTMESLLQNKDLQNMVQSFVKDKSPEELNAMVSKVFGNMNKK